MFDQLDFIYVPSRDVAADLNHFPRGLGAEIVFEIEGLRHTRGGASARARI
jgi:hypothetical protein